MKEELSSAGTVSNQRRTVGEAIDDYEVTREAQGLSRGTFDQNRWQLNIVRDGLGRQRVASLTVAECDSFLEAAARGIGERRPISRAHVARIRFVLINVLANEMRVGHLTRNVAELAILPADTVEKKERRALNSEELAALLGAATGSRLVLIDLIARNGLRPAEARALRWSDVDLELGRLTVSGQLNRQNQRTKPKTRRSARSLQLDETTISRLRAWSDEQAELRKTARNAWIDLDIIASTARGNPIDRHAFARSLRTLCASCEIDPPINPYELRHTAITMQADAGHSSWDIADWAGTSEQMISEVYRHRLTSVSRLKPPGRSVPE
jgi:integrase